MDKLLPRTAASVIAAILLTTSTVTGAQSPTWFGNAADGQWLFGAKIGTLQNGLPAYTDAQTLTLMGGYEFKRIVGDKGSAAIEVEWMTTYDEGGIRDSRAEWEADNIAIFMTYRTPGDIYFKGKLGIYTSDVEVNLSDRQVVSESDTAFGYGIGLGYRFKNNTSVELEFTGNGSDRVNDLSGFSIGGHISF